MTNDAADADGGAPQRGVFGVSAAVYAQRDGKILILKRAGGEMTGAWYLPGGGVDAGESPQRAARRELREEAGLDPDGPLTLIGLTGPVHLYGVDAVQASYAVDCPDGDVTLSHEHAGFRWLDPVEYRDRYFGDTQLARVAEGDPRRLEIVRQVRQSLDEYIAWLDHRAEDARLRGEG